MAPSFDTAVQSAPAVAAPGARAGTPRFDYGGFEQVREAARTPRLTLAALAVIALFFAWFFRINAEQLVSTWYSNPNWSHGFLVPLISLYMLYLNRDLLHSLRPEGSAVGLLLLGYGVASQVLFRLTGQPQASNLTILVVLFGLVLWLLGWQFMKILWLPICYLLFMINPPEALYVKITTPLQVFAAAAGVHLMNFMGVHAMRIATQVHLQKGTHWFTLNVAQACSGIRMLTAFFALAVAMAYTTPRPVWEKLLLAACALPVAISCNAVRVAITGVLYVTAGKVWAQGATHEYVGLAMLLPAVALQWFAAWTLDHLFIETDHPQKPSGQPAGGKA